MTRLPLLRSQRLLSITDRLAGGVRGSRFGLFGVALVVGVGSGFGAVIFRYLISFFTWLATGHSEFGQNGYVGSSHLPWLGLGFFVVIPVIGGILYGPLVYRFAREARGHGVPEVMVAVAENGGRIRPQVAVVKALASALTIASGGSVGREGPIVQIGSALASSFGQWVRMPENRMRILVACGAGGGIAATFNAPITGVFFGVEIILREFSVDAMFAVMLSAMVADAVAIPFLGNEHFLSGFPAGIVLHDPRNYLLVAALAVIAALIGLLFKTVLYAVEDLCDRIWKGRPEWARPAMGGVLLGVVLLAVPQLYGVGYPVMFKVVAGDYTLWFLLILTFGKIVATSLTLGIGGSGGVFGPSLFIGATAGMAFGVVADQLFGPGAGNPALYAVVAMGAVFTSAARAPLTSLASVVELTGDFTLTLPVMLAVGIATAVSRGMSYSTIYTAKLLRRGQDIDRAAPWRAFTDLKAAGAMRTFATPLDLGAARHTATVPTAIQPTLPGAVSFIREPQAVFATEPLADVLRQLEVFGRDGLPVLSDDGRHVEGWITNESALQ
ncbi:MAG TPA: chloride channel protein, partial [Gemmatimonadales bacterium]|nr:chloride channel protein [Gemmatimonadales bacterium]